jgi:CRISPR-associated protein Csd1
MQKAIERMRAEMGRGDWIDQARRDARAALIKAVLNRNYGMEVRRDMDPTNRKDGYVLGRLMAVLERLQAEAQGNVNATVIDRYFSGASAAPKSVFPRLMKNARNHVRKLREDKGGLVFWLERMLDECAGPFETDAPYPNSGGNFPAYLSLEQQGLFILGYHQMRRWLWMTQEERAAWEAKYPNAPKAYKKAASTQATEIVTE